MTTIIFIIIENFLNYYIILKVIIIMQYYIIIVILKNYDNFIKHIFNKMHKIFNISVIFFQVSHNRLYVSGLLLE